MIRGFSARFTDPWVGRSAADRPAGMRRDRAERSRCAADGREAGLTCPACGTKHDPEAKRGPGFDLHAMAATRHCDDARPSIETERVARLLTPLYRAFGRDDTLIECLQDQPLAVARVPARLAHGIALGAAGTGEGAWSGLPSAVRRDLVQTIDRAFTDAAGPLAQALGEDLAALGADRLRGLASGPIDVLAFEAGRLLGPGFAATALGFIDPAKRAASQQLPRLARVAANLPAFVAARAAVQKPAMTVHWSADQLAAIGTLRAPRAIDDVVVAPLPAARIGDWNATARRAAELLAPGRGLALELVGTPREIDLAIDALRRATFVLEVHRDGRGARIQATR